jgi:hypothetical protein
MRSHCLTIAAGVAVAALATQAEAAEVSVTSAKDNTLYADPEGDVSNGDGEYFFVGRSGPFSGNPRRGILAFELAGLLPDGAIIQSVELRLHMSMTNSPGQTILMHRLLADWGEGTSQADGNEGGGADAEPGDATWLHRYYDDTFWTNPGGDFDAIVSASTFVDSNFFYHTWTSAQMIVDVQAWIADPSSNFGWILIGDESMNQTAMRFGTHENETAAYRPMLIITYVPAPGALALLGIVALAPRRRRRL